MLTWGGYAESWLDQTDIPVHLVRYEDLKADTAGELHRAMAFAGIAVSHAECEQAARFADFDALKQQESERGFREAPRSAPGGNFFRRGIAGGWRDELSAGTDRADRGGSGCHDGTFGLYARKSRRKDVGLIKRSGDWLSAKVGDEIMMMSAARGNYLGVNAVGARIWELIETPSDIDTICATLVRRIRGRSGDVPQRGRPVRGGDGQAWRDRRRSCVNCARSPASACGGRGWWWRRSPACCARASIVLLRPFPKVSRGFGEFVAPSDPRVTGSGAGATPEQARIAKEIGWAVAAAAPFMPFRSVCLQQAMAAHAMLRRRGIASVMHFGAGKSDEKPIDAHAWLDAAGVKVTGYPVATDLAELGCFV